MTSHNTIREKCLSGLARASIPERGMRMSRPDTHGSTRSRGRADAYDPVLTAKVTVPDLPGWAVARPRIDRLIADGTRGPLTLVTGPPGAGKTMAIAAWTAARNPGALAWLTVD